MRLSEKCARFLTVPVQSYAIWTMIKFQGETINLNKFYKDK